MNMEFYKRAIGRIGENEARQFLINHGYKIVCQNYRVMGCGEIDIIAEDGGTLVIIEVKKRTNKNFEALEAITKSKKLRLAKTAEVFLSVNSQYENWPVRFDVVAIDGVELELLKDAFIIY